MSKLTIKITPGEASNSLSFSGNYRLFSNDEPITDAMGVLRIYDEVDMGSGLSEHLRRYFRYSIDRISWSMWYEFVPDGSPDQGMAAITDISLNPANGLYIEYKYEYNDGTFEQLETPVTVAEISTQLEISDTAPSVDLESVVTSSCTSEYCPSLVFDREASFNPYDIGAFVDIYAETSLYVNKTFGIPVVYFRTEPAISEGGQDNIFKEWNLTNVVERKCIKVLVPNNDFPDSKLHYNEFGIDYEVPFEVHIDKRYFEMMFNPSAEVRKRDFLYFPMLNRMYEIQGSYMYRGLMMKPMYWKAQLVKFKPNINYLMNAETTQFLDNLLLDTEETLSKLANEDIKDATMPQQFKTISSRYDETRSDLSGKMSVRQERYYFNYAALVDYYYDLGSGLAPNSVPVKYKANGVLDDTMKNIACTMMFNVRTNGKPFVLLESWKAGSPDPSTGMRISGVLNGSTLTITVNVNGVLGTYNFQGVVIGRWYSLVVQLSLEYRQLGVFMYDPVDDALDPLNHNEFKLKMKYVTPITDAYSFNTGAPYQLVQGPIYFANLRVFNRTLKQEEHQNILSQLFVQDESMLYIIDNCRPRLDTPIVAKVR